MEMTANPIRNQYANVIIYRLYSCFLDRDNIRIHTSIKNSSLNPQKIVWKRLSYYFYKIIISPSSGL